MFLGVLFAKLIIFPGYHTFFKVYLQKFNSFTTFALMKHIFYFFHLLTFLGLVFVANAKSNPYYDFCKKYAVKSSSGVPTLQGLTGDSIHFDFDCDTPLYNVFISTPDTIWIKPDRPKKPKEGKHYLLSYQYKGRLEGKKNIYTDPSDFRGHTFVLKDVADVKDQKNIYNILAVNITLFDPATSKNVTLVIDRNLPCSLQLTSESALRKLENLKGKILYYDSYDITDSKSLSCSDAYFSETITCSPGGMISVMPYAKLTITAEDDKVFHITSDNFDSYKDRKYLSPLEYEQRMKEHQRKLEEERIRQEKERLRNMVYTVPTEIPDSLDISAAGRIITDYVVGHTKSYSYISQSVKPSTNLGSSNSLGSGEYVVILDKKNIRDVDYYLAARDGKLFYIKAADVDADEDKIINLMNTIQNLPEDTKEMYLYKGMYDSYGAFWLNKKEAFDKIEKYKKRGIVVLDADVYDMGEYSDATGMRFEVWNTSDKMIKYITINFVGYNAVDDPVTSWGQKTITKRCIGPIEPGDTATYEFDYAWWTSIVEYAEIKSMVVEYKGGTKKTFTGTAVEPIPEELIETLEEESPVKDLLPLYD